MKCKAFTLSEVLITLVIIGVLAALTIPIVMNRTHEHEYRSAIKKAISILNQALERNYAYNSLTAADYSSGKELADELFKKRLNVIDGETTFTNGCEGGGVFTTEDGIIFCITKDFKSEGENICDIHNLTPCGTEPNIYIDVNGLKNPNKLTISSEHPKDIYEATIYAQKVVPYGDATQEVIYGKYGLENQNNEDGNSSNPGTGGGGKPGTNPNPGNTNPENPNPTNPEPSNPNPTNPDPTNPDIDQPYPDIDPNNPEIPDYDPNRWPTWEDFLNWLRDVLGAIFG